MTTLTDAQGWPVARDGGPAFPRPGFTAIETMQERTWDPDQQRRLKALQKDLRETTVEQLTKKPK